MYRVMDMYICVAKGTIKYLSFRVVFRSSGKSNQVIPLALVLALLQFEISQDV